MSERQRITALEARLNMLCSVLMSETALAADYSRLMDDVPTHHPAPSAATGEGEVRYYRHIDSICVPFAKVLPDGTAISMREGTPQSHWTKSVDEFVRRGFWIPCDEHGNDLTPTEAAALHAPRKTEAEGADTPTPPEDDAAGESPLYIGYQQCLDWLRKGVEAHWPVDADSDPDDPLTPEEDKPLGTVTYFEYSGDRSVGMDGYNGLAFVPRDGLVLVRADELAKLRAPSPAPGLREAAKAALAELEGYAEYGSNKADHICHALRAALAATPAQTAGVPEEVRRKIADGIAQRMLPDDKFCCGDEFGHDDRLGSMNHPFRSESNPTLGYAARSLRQNIVDALLGFEHAVAMSALTPTTAPAGEVAGG